MFKRNVALVSLSLVLLQACTFAGGQWAFSADESVGRVTTVKKGEQVPYDGVLMDQAASAHVVAELEKTKAECQESIRYLQELREIEKSDLKERAKIQLDAETQRCDARVASLEKQVAYLEDELAKKDDPNTALWFALGAGGGLIVGVVATAVGAAVASSARE